MGSKGSKSLLMKSMKVLLVKKEKPLTEKLLSILKKVKLILEISEIMKRMVSDIMVLEIVSIRENIRMILRLMGLFLT